MKKILTVVLFFVVIISSVHSFSGCQVQGDAMTYVNLSVNPNIEFILNTADVVVSANAINEEAEMLLVNKDYKGDAIEHVVKDIMNTMSKAALIDIQDEKGFIQLTVINDNATKANDVYYSIKSSCENYCKSNGIYSVVVNGQLPSEVVTLSSQYNLEPAHFRLVLKAYELNPNLEFNELINMNKQTLIQKINKSFNNQAGILTSENKQEFKTELINLRKTYENKKENLFNKEYKQLKEELKLMEDQIQTTEGEALNNLKNVFKKQTKQIKTLEHNLKASYDNEYTALIDSFNRDKERLINAYTKKSKGKIKRLQTNLQKRMNENSQLFKLRQSYAKKRINNFEIKYDEYVKLTTINMLNFLKTKDSETKEYNEQLNKDLSNAITHAKKYVKLY